jgi:spermidine/putrescine transport system substrate-binding protein
VGTPLRRMSPWGLCLLWLAGALFSCGQGAGSDPAESRPVLHYFTWSDYVGPDIIQEFERRERVKVVIDTFSSNEELLAKLQSGATGYDVAVPSDFMVAIMIQQGAAE